MRISVVVATCEGAAYAGEQVRSILGQTRPPDEVVVADDASTDGTPERVAHALAAAPAGTRAELVRGEVRRGLPGNLERAIARTDGGVVLFADQDDVWEPGKAAALEAVLAARPEVRLAFSDAALIGPSGTRASGAALWSRVGFTPRRRRAFARDPLGVLLRRTVVTGATMAVRRDLLDAARPLPAEGWHDAWLALLAALRGPEAIAAVEAPLLRYRIHEANLAGVPRSGLWARYGALRWPRAPVLRQWERAGALAAPGPGRERLAAARAFHERRPGT